MCIKLIKDGDVVVGFKFDLKRTIASIFTTATLLTACGVIVAKCNNITACAQEKFVRPEAERVFVEKIKPYDTLWVEFARNQRVTNEILKLLANDPEIIKKAIENVENSGKLPIRRQ